MRRVLAVWIFVAMVCPRVAAAHPLGMTSVNRYLGVRPEARALVVQYLLDLAELPAYGEIESLDADHDERVTPIERDRYLDGFIARLLPELALTVDGRHCAPRETFRALEAPPGQEGMSTLRIALEFQCDLPAVTSPRPLTVTVREALYDTRSGWREMSPQSSPTATLRTSSLPGGPSAGARLEYPTSPDGVPTPGVRLPRQDSATFVYTRHPAGVTVDAPRVTPRRWPWVVGAVSAVLAAVVVWATRRRAGTAVVGSAR